MIGTLTTPTNAKTALARSARRRSSIAARSRMIPMYWNNRINSDVSRASHTHQAPQVGLPHIAPVSSARNVNIAPVGAMAWAIMNEGRAFNPNPTPAHAAMMTYRNMDIQAAGTWTKITRYAS